MKKGTWVCNIDGTHIGRVRDAYECLGESLIDVVLYAHDGERIGRESPVEGGPSSYEPACTAANWRPIEAPDFKEQAKLGPAYGGYWNRVTPIPSPVEAP